MSWGSVPGGGNNWSITGNGGTTASTSTIGTTVNNNFIGTTDAKDFVLATNNLERFRIANDGSIGIGTVTPTLAHVTIAGTSTPSSKFLVAGIVNSSATDFQYGINNVASFTPAANLVSLYGTVSAPRITGGSATITNLMASVNRIDLLSGYTGNVSSAYSFNVQDAIVNSGTITSLAGIDVIEQTKGTNNTNLLIGGSIPAGNFSIYNSSTRSNYFAGNVGLGTTNPSVKLQIVGGNENITQNDYAIYSGTTYTNSVNVSPVFVGYRGRGTSASPSNVLNGDVLACFQGRNAILAPVAWGGLFVAAAEDQTSSANQGNYLFFQTTQIGSSTPVSRMYISDAGNVSIGAGLVTGNAKFTVRDGHLQIWQTTAPAITSAVTYSTYGLTNSTDVAGNISITTTAAAGSVTITFNKPYTTAPIVTLTPTNSAGATDVSKVYVTTTTTTFTINYNASPAAGIHTYSYHVIETQ